MINLHDLQSDSDSDDVTTVTRRTGRTPSYRKAAANPVVVKTNVGRTQSYMQATEDDTINEVLPGPVASNKRKKGDNYCVCVLCRRAVIEFGLT